VNLPRSQKRMRRAQVMNRSGIIATRLRDRILKEETMMSVTQETT